MGRFSIRTTSSLGLATPPEPFRDLLSDLSQLMTLEEDTDLNEDVSVVFLLASDERRWSLQLSLVGPWAVLFRVEPELTGGSMELVPPSSPECAVEEAVFEALERHGLLALRRDELAQPIDFNCDGEGPVPVSLYRVAFSSIEFAL
jgi:hypothetical protein